MQDLAASSGKTEIARNTSLHAPASWHQLWRQSENDHRAFSGPSLYLNKKYGYDIHVCVYLPQCKYLNLLLPIPNKIGVNIFFFEEVFLIWIFAVLLQTQGRSSPLVRRHISTLQQNKQIVCVERHRNIQQWTPGAPPLRAHPQSAPPCRWSHSHRDRSDVRLCGSGRDRALHREDDTVSKEDLIFPVPPPALFNSLLLWSNPDLFVRVSSLGRFFTLLHRETVVVNRWFTCFPYWHSCPACLSDLCPPRQQKSSWALFQKFLVNDWEPQEKEGRFITHWFVPLWFWAQTGTSCQ